MENVKRTEGTDMTPEKKSCNDFHMKGVPLLSLFMKVITSVIFWHFFFFCCCFLFFNTYFFQIIFSFLFFFLLFAWLLSCDALKTS